MILYKYLSYKNAMAMLRTSTLGFTRPSALNDPFETTAAAYPGDNDNFWRGFGRRFAIETNYAILSLTRNPLSPLQWSHYGDSHTGLVIGIDTAIAQLHDPIACVLPAKYGSVIYTLSKPNHGYDFSATEQILDGRLSCYDPNYLEALQRLFLYKSSEWHYEEEVRVVKTVDAILQSSGGRPLDPESTPINAKTFLFNMPSTAIVSVYMGLRTCQDYEQLWNLYEAINDLLPHAELHDYRIASDSWRLTSRHLTDWRATIHSDYYPE